LPAFDFILILLQFGYISGTLDVDGFWIDFVSAWIGCGLAWLWVGLAWLWVGWVVGWTFKLWEHFGKMRVQVRIHIGTFGFLLHLFDCNILTTSSQTQFGNSSFGTTLEK